MENIFDSPSLPVTAHGCSEYLLLFTSTPGERLRVPGLELGYFQAKEMMEPTLVRWITNICTLHPSFYLDPNDHEQGNSFMKDLAQRLHLLDDFLISNGCPGFHSITPEWPESPTRILIDQVVLLKKRGASESALLINSFNLTSQ